MFKAILVFALMLVIAVALVPGTNAFFGYAECQQAEAFGWHSNWANQACFSAIVNDIIGGGGWE
jgi:hypothetical protein